MRRYLFNIEKINYVRGDKPGVDCILCAIRDAHPDVRDLVVFRGVHAMVTINLYPFNPGHLMIFPMRHIDDYTRLDPDEAGEIHDLTVRSINVLNQEFSPTGFNMGYNLGQGSGASIRHVHQHLVPRYANEVGFLDVLAGTRVQITDPGETMDLLKKRFGDFRA